MFTFSQTVVCTWHGHVYGGKQGNVKWKLWNICNTCGNIWDNLNLDI